MQHVAASSYLVYRFMMKCITLHILASLVLKRKTYSCLCCTPLDFENMVKNLVFIFPEQDLILEWWFFLKTKLLRLCMRGEGRNRIVSLKKQELLSGLGWPWEYFKEYGIRLWCSDLNLLLSPSTILVKYVETKLIWVFCYCKFGWKWSNAAGQDNFWILWNQE